MFTPSEANLIESAREDILLRRHFTDGEFKRQQLIFLAVVVMTILFPLIGLLALCGAFDSTVSWYTHGEMHAFTGAQRVFLKVLLVIEVILYTVLLIVLTVHYSIGF